MIRKTTQQIIGHEVTEHIYVKADGRTVCQETDKDCAFLLHAKGERVSEAQVKNLIFPDAANPVPDAEQRSEPIADAEKRNPKRK